MIIDLQVHSVYSDGYLRPTELAEMLKKQGVLVASLTDHNTVGGLDEFARACHKRGITPIVGMELYVRLNHKKFNILWFNFDKDHPDLHKALHDTHVRRKTNARKILNNLKNSGFRLNVEKILDRFNRYTPINHMVDEFLSQPGVLAQVKKTLKTDEPREDEVMREYFFNPKYGVLRETYMNVSRVLSLRQKVGGQIILNHPGKNNCLRYDFLVKLKKLGFDGLEVVSPHHSIGATMYAQYLARKFDFIETGGTDYHKDERVGALIQNCYAYFKVDSRHLYGIEKIIGKIDKI
jgi:predicted metal-dependent phosphoesterase TrpH